MVWDCPQRHGQFYFPWKAKSILSSKGSEDSWPELPPPLSVPRTLDRSFREILSLDSIILLHVSECSAVYVCAPHVWTGVLGGCESPCGCWEGSLSPLQVLPTTEPPLQPLEGLNLLIFRTGIYTVTYTLRQLWGLSEVIPVRYLAYYLVFDKCKILLFNYKNLL